MECNHVIGIDTVEDYPDAEIYYLCLNCPAQFKKEDVAVITKAQHLLEQVVLKELRKADPAHMKFLFESKDLPIAAGRMLDIQKALVALYKGK